MKTQLIILLILLPLFIHSQSKEELLESRVENIGLKKIEKLKEYGLLSDSDMQSFAIFLVQFSQETDFAKLKYKDLLEIFQQRKENQIKKIASQNNFGNDSIFIITPYGDKIFVGKGQLSMEKLVERESKNLPEKYENEFMNQSINSPKEVASAINKLNLSEEILMLFGNTFMIIGMSDIKLNTFTVGDLVEIATRISKAEEFAPFMPILKKQ